MDMQSSDAASSLLHLLQGRLLTGYNELQEIAAQITRKETILNSVLQMLRNQLACTIGVNII